MFSWGDVGGGVRGALARLRRRGDAGIICTTGGWDGGFGARLRRRDAAVGRLYMGGVARVGIARVRALRGWGQVNRKNASPGMLGPDEALCVVLSLMLRIGTQRQGSGRRF